MPVEIRELVIRATVDDVGTGGTGRRPGELEQERAEIVAACVEEVAKIMRRKQER